MSGDFLLTDIQLFWVGDRREPIRPQIEPTVLEDDDGEPSHLAGIQENGEPFTEALADITSIVVRSRHPAGDCFEAIVLPEGLTAACGFEEI